MHALLGNCGQYFFVRPRRRAAIVLGCAGILLLLPCSGRQSGLAFPVPRQARNAGLSISSPSFPSGGEIPKKFTCSGVDVSPELSWTQPPAGTKTFALLVDDPDAPAGNWNHWAIWNLPASARSLPEGVGKSQRLPDGSQQGLNDFRKIGYSGPCPPANKPHHYHFKLYALDTKLSLNRDAGKPELEAAMKGHILAQAEWMGTFHR
ncbi:MAG: YbhB/YbcL family Raf kinase inhibitor-like protein [Candidatus Sulfotelmatobacter sp.]